MAFSVHQYTYYFLVANGKAMTAHRRRAGAASVQPLRRLLQKPRNSIPGRTVPVHLREHRADIK